MAPRGRPVLECERRESNPHPLRDRNLNPLDRRDNPLSANELRPSRGFVAHPLPTDTRQTPPDLAAVIDAWPDLPEPIRAGILALVKAVSVGS